VPGNGPARMGDCVSSLRATELRKEGGKSPGKGLRTLVTGHQAGEVEGGRWKEEKKSPTGTDDLEVTSPSPSAMAYAMGNKRGDPESEKNVHSSTGDLEGRGNTNWVLLLVNENNTGRVLTGVHCKMAKGGRRVAA